MSLNYSEIRTHVRGMIKKTDSVCPDSLFDTWQTLVTQTLNNDLFMNRQVTEAEVIMTSNPFQLYTDDRYREVMEVKYADGDQRRRIEPANRAQVTSYLGLGGNPLFFNMEGNKIRVAPYVDQLRIWVTLRSPYFDLDGPGAENFVTQSHANLVINLFAYHGAMYFKDFEAAQLYGATYDSELTSINDRYTDIQTNENLQMKGASSWV